MAFLKIAQRHVKRKLVEELLALRGVKFQLAVEVELRKDEANSTEVLQAPVFRTKQITLLQAYEIPQALHEAFPTILKGLEKFIRKGSGWIVDLVKTLWLDITHYQPLCGGSYLPLDTAVKNKNAIFNVKNKDDDCLRWSLRAALFPAARNLQRPGKYPTEDGLDFAGVSSHTAIPARTS